MCIRDRATFIPIKIKAYLPFLVTVFPVFVIILLFVTMPANTVFVIDFMLNENYRHIKLLTHSKDEIVSKIQ